MGLDNAGLVVDSGGGSEDGVVARLLERLIGRLSAGPKSLIPKSFVSRISETESLGLYPIDENERRPLLLDSLRPAGVDAGVKNAADLGRAGSSVASSE